MRSPGRSRTTRLFGQGLARWRCHRAQCSQPSAWARHRGPFWPPDQHVCRPAPDDRKLFDRPVVVEDATHSLSMKRTSWTSQLS
jgi:hypothetical protein